MKLNGILKQKTTWAGIAGLVSAATGFFTEAMTPDVSIQLAVLSLMGIFLRQGVAKAQNNMENIAKRRIRKKKAAVKDTMLDRARKVARVPMNEGEI